MRLFSSPPVEVYCHAAIRPNSAVHDSHAKPPRTPRDSAFAERDDYDADTIAYHCWATVHGIASLQTTVLLAERPDVEVVIRRILKQVIDGFTVDDAQRPAA